MSTGTLALIVLLLAVAVGLAATNPTMDDYGRFLETTLGQALSRIEQDQNRQGDLVRELLRSRGKQVIDSLVKPNTSRRSYGLFTVFETRVLDSRVLVLGVARTFVPLEGVEELTLRVGRLELWPVR
ncbi:MAG: DUF4359 domain-containing protein [Nitrospirota bacterium]